MSDGDAILHIIVCMGGASGKDNKTEFKIKRKTKMGKVFAAYAKVKGQSQGQLKFLLDGERILEHQTPKMLEMEDGDQIDAFIEQVGGNVQPSQ